MEAIPQTDTSAPTLPAESAIPVIASARALTAWAEGAPAGAWALYHRGFLARDRVPRWGVPSALSAQLGLLADTAMRMAEEGRVTLCQLRRETAYGAVLYDYFAVKL